MNPTVALTEASRTAIVSAAREALPREFIALLAGPAASPRIVVTDVEPLANRAPQGDRFAVDPVAFAAAEGRLRDRGLRFVGFVHSHPGGSDRPSAADLRALWPNCLHLIVGIAGRGACAMAAYRRDQDALREVTVRRAEHTQAADACATARRARTSGT